MTDLAEIMQKTIKSIAADQAIVNAARRMRDERIGSLLVEENDDYVGILTETDIVRKAAAEGKDLSTLSVKKLMTQPLVSIESTKTVRDANDMMSKALLHNWPVLVDVVTMGDGTQSIHLPIPCS